MATAGTWSSGGTRTFCSSGLACVPPGRVDRHTGVRGTRQRNAQPSAISFEEEMTIFSTLLLALVSTHGIGQDTPQDGIYLRAHAEPAPSVLSQDGQTLFLGAKQPLEILDREFFSQNNGNTKFYLSLTIAYDESVGPSTYILIVAGTAYRQGGSGASGQETSSLSFYVSGQGNATEVSEYIKTPVVYRRHPGHSLLVSFNPTEQEFTVGDEVSATLQIVNVGTDPVSFMKGGRNRAARDNQYVFSARFAGEQAHDIGTSYHFGGLATRLTLNPGEVFEDKISLSKWFAFSESGVYEIHGSYYVAFSDPDAESWRTIWEDYVSADFIVRIE